VKRRRGDEPPDTQRAKPGPGFPRGAAVFLALCVAITLYALLGRPGLNFASLAAIPEPTLRLPTAIASDAARVVLVFSGLVMLLVVGGAIRKAWATRKNWLERGPSFSMIFGWLAGLAAACVFIVALMWLATAGPKAMKLVLPRSEPWLVLLTLVPALLLFAAFAAAARKTLVARRWPVVTGRIERSGTTQQDRGVEKAYFPLVEYSYSVGGVRRLGHSILPDQVRGGSQAYAARIAARYPVGGAVRVHYDPSDPAQTALEFSLGLAWLLPVLGLLLLLAAWTFARWHGVASELTCPV
jgi:hypothetical protein